jgi:hypothetical protein
MGALMTGLAPALGALFPWVLLPVTIMTVLAAVRVRGHRAENERVQLALEQGLDRLERGELRTDPGLGAPAAVTIGRLADELKRTLDF